MTSDYYDFVQRKNPFRQTGSFDGIKPISSSDPTQPAGAPVSLPSQPSGGVHPSGSASSPPINDPLPKPTVDRTIPNDLNDAQYIKFFDGANGSPPAQYAALAQQNKDALAKPADINTQAQALAHGDSLKWDSLHKDWYAPSHPGDITSSTRGGPDYAGHKPELYGADYFNERKAIADAKTHLLEGFGQALTQQSPALQKLNDWNKQHEPQTPWSPFW